MQVKWGIFKHGTLGKYDLNRNILDGFYGGGMGRTSNFDKADGPKGTKDGYRLGAGEDMLIMGGRSSIADAVEQFGPYAWHGPSFVSSFAVQVKSGSLFVKNMTLLIITTDQKLQTSRTLKAGPVGEIEFAPKSIDIKAYALSKKSVADFVRKL